MTTTSYKTWCSVGSKSHKTLIHWPFNKPNTLGIIPFFLIYWIWMDSSDNTDQVIMHGWGSGLLTVEWVFNGQLYTHSFWFFVITVNWFNQFAHFVLKNTSYSFLSKQLTNFRSQKLREKSVSNVNTDQWHCYCTNALVLCYKLLCVGNRIVFKDIDTTIQLLTLQHVGR